MARVRYLEFEDASDELRQVIDESSPNVVRLIGRAESVVGPWLRLIRAILHETRLPSKLRELVILYVAQRGEADYMWAQHLRWAARVGLTEAQVDAMRSGDITADCLNAAERAVLSFAAQMLTTGRPDDASFDALDAQAGLSEAEIVELAFIVGTYRGVANTFVALDLELDPSLIAERDARA